MQKEERKGYLFGQNVEKIESPRLVTRLVRDWRARSRICQSGSVFPRRLDHARFPNAICNRVFRADFRFDATRFKV